MKKYYSLFFSRTMFVAFLCLVFLRGSGQTNPASHDLSLSDFSFLGFSTGTITTYPTSMQGWKFPSEPGVGFTAGGDGDRSLEVSTATVTSGNIRNEISNGVSLLNSASNNIGAIVISLNTLNRTGVKVAWTVEDITSASSRQNGMRLQYRVGTSGNFTEVSASTYLSNASGVKAKESFSEIELPADVDNKAVVQIRWLYFLNSGSGSRDRLRLDDINIKSVAAVSCTSPNIYFATSSYSVNEGSASFTQTASSSSSGTITYSSSNNSVASVNATTGQITVGVAGSATITATQVANGIFCGDTATYTITVNSTSPTIVPTGAITALSTVYGTASTTRNFSFSASNLTGSQVVATAPAGFEISNTDGGSYSNTTNFAVTAGGATGTVYIRLSKNTSVGLHSGDINLADNSNSATASVSIPSSSVSLKVLTIIGISANDKVYDGGITATISGTPGYSGLENGEVFAVTGSVTWAFSSKNVGATVNRTGVYIAPSSNYSVTQPTLTANIIRKALTVSGAVAQNKSFDNTLVATITGATLVGVISPDVVTISGGGNFNDVNVGSGKPVTAALVLGGGGSGNYILTQPNGLTANITAVSPSFTTSNIGISTGSTYLLPGTNISSNSAGSMSYSLATPSPSGSITLTGGNTLTGIAPGTALLTVNQVANGNYTAGSTTVQVIVSSVTYVAGDFRSLFDTGLSYNSGWEYYNGNGWVVPPSNRGPQNTTVTINNIYINHSVDGGATATRGYSCNFIIGNGGALQLSDIASTPAVFVDSGKKMEVLSGGKLLISGDVSVWDSTSKLIVRNGGEMILNSSKMSNANFLWGGTELFENGSTITISDWRWASNNTDRPLIATTSQISQNTDGYLFGNLIIDTTLGDDWTLLSGSGNSNLKFTQNNFEISNASTSKFVTGTSNTNSGFIINGDFIIYDGAFNFGTTFTGTISFANNYTINGNFSCISDDALRLHHIVAGTSTPTGNLTINGNVTIDSSVAFGNSGNKKIVLEAGSVLLSKTIDVKTIIPNTVIDINSGYRLLKNNLALGSNSKFNVLTGATLDFGFNGLNALNITGNSGGQAFSAASGSTLKITSPQGLTKTANTGNVQVPIASRVYDAGAIYHYIGKADQATGNGLPDGLTARLIVDLQTDSTNENLNFTSSSSTKFNSSGILEIRRGKVIDAPNNGFRNNIPVENEDGETDAQKGNLMMTGGRYVVSGSGTKPSLSGNYTLTAGTVEFAGDAATKIRIGTTPKQYWKVDISGTNVVSGGKNLIINDKLKVISSTAILTIPREDDNANPYLVTAKEGVDVVAGGKLLFKNNATLLQNATAVNSGSITMAREVVDMNNIPTHMDYVYWSSPVSGQIIKGTSGFSPQTPEAGFQQYREDTDRFITTPDAEFQRAKGYSVQAESNPKPNTSPAEYYPNPYNKEYTFTGTPYNGSFTSQVLSKSAGEDKGYNLIGNPYPSAIDFDLLYALNANSSKIYSSAFFWTNNTFTPFQMGSGYKGNNYAIYNGTGGNPATYNATDTFYTAVVDGKIKIGQAFIVQSKNAGTIDFANSIRLASTGRFYQKKTAKNRFWLTLTSPAEMVNTILVGYIPGATDAYEKDFDGELFAIGSDSFYSILGANKLAIQGKAENFSADDVVPVGNVFEANGNYTIKLQTAEGVFDGGQDIFLRDKLLNKFINLSIHNSYTFSANKGTDDTRFEIVYKDGTILGSNETEKSDFTVYKDRENFVVLSSKSLGKVELYDAAGRLVRQLSTKDNKLTIDVTGLPTSVYIIKAENSGEIKTKKIIK